MLLNFKVAGSLCLAGLSAASCFYFGRSCSYSKTIYFYKSALDTNESVLDCEGYGKKYSVFLAFKENRGSETDQEDALSFKVVDNNDWGKVKWGPGSDLGDVWTGWGIGVYKSEDTEGGTKHTAVIRVPKKGNVYDQKQPWTTIRIPCQKNNLKLKEEINSDPWCKCGGGALLRSKDMKLELLPEGGVKITNKFDFKDDFQPKRIWCTS